VLGHFRHEVGHYYWPILVEQTGELERWRELFGDERIDYEESLQRHYEQGPPADWSDRHVSAYATMHPWEDWAETFAHYLHHCQLAAHGIPRPASPYTNAVRGVIRRAFGLICIYPFSYLMVEAIRDR
jgi:hypothetical protein